MPHPDVTDMEWEILEECNGDRPARQWGAAVGACLGFLRGKGFVDRHGQITDAGRTALATRKEPS